VTNTTGPGVVGVPGLSRFVALSGEPPYPALDPDPLAYAMLGVVPVGIVLVCTGFVSILSRTIKNDEQSDDAASSLYDEQSADPDTGDMEMGSDKKSGSEGEDAMENENPYETSGDVCL
jgi:hypothetical protein